MVNYEYTRNQLSKYVLLLNYFLTLWKLLAVWSRRGSARCCRAATMWSAASTARFGEVDCGLWNQSKNLDISTKTMGLLSWLIKKCRRSSCRTMPPGIASRCFKVCSRHFTVDGLLVLPVTFGYFWKPGPPWQKGLDAGCRVQVYRWHAVFILDQFIQLMTCTWCFSETLVIFSEHVQDCA